jgi:hypothetical protein
MSGSYIGNLEQCNVADGYVDFKFFLMYQIPKDISNARSIPLIHEPR